MRLSYKKKIAIILFTTALGIGILIPIAIGLLPYAFFTVPAVLIAVPIIIIFVKDTK